MVASCPCCDSAISVIQRTPRLVVRWCAECGTYRAEHLEPTKGMDIWKSETISPAFLGALGYRRSVQSKQIIRCFKTILEYAPVLDYGCGQGIFVAELLAQGYQATGCDLSESVFVSKDPGRFIVLDEPWSFPARWSFNTVSLLDVLEHCPDPVQFLRLLKDRHVEHVLVKVPVANGPVFAAAWCLARVGFPGALERLFLVGDAVPHVSYFTPRGLGRLFEKTGFRLTSSVKMAEVGRELPARLRQSSSPGKGLSLVFMGLGCFLAGLSLAWSDLMVFRFDRAN